MRRQRAARIRWIAGAPEYVDRNRVADGAAGHGLDRGTHLGVEEKRMADPHFETALGGQDDELLGR